MNKWNVATFKDILINVSDLQAPSKPESECMKYEARE